ncbi:DUF378 domain-containing protein [Neobacillus sp. NPDC093127]|uniref:DUF378 domain-containing protein n=1 Tax=Neobacillus sp. NPDC093127 TaxID=3364296 RepID=UPI00381A7DB8
MRTIHRIALVLVIIGAINWGLIGLFRFDLVAAIFGGQGAFLSRVIYSLVGLSGLICISLLFIPSRNEEHEVNRQGTGNLNYATEFGEETDLSKLKKD